MTADNGEDGSARFLVEVTVPPNETLTLVGITQIAETSIDYFEGNNYTYSYRLVSVEGFDEPTECRRCGCGFHGHTPASCPDCKHPLCATTIGGSDGK